MPELPEVQTVVNDLQAAGLIGATITDAQVYWPRTIAALTPKAFRLQITGQTLSVIRRRAKYIVFEFAKGGSLLIHLRMTGRLHLASSSVVRSKHEHVILSFEDQLQLRFHDTRKFGRFYLAKNCNTILGNLGPEPLEPTFTPQVLVKYIGYRKRLIKPLLLDQTVIAGLGNIYVDEALWESAIHPCRLASSLSASELKALHRAILKVLKQGLKNLGTTLGTGKANFYSLAQRKGRNRDQLKVFRRMDLPCPRCKNIIVRIKVDQRSTHICATCQKL